MNIHKRNGGQSDITGFVRNLCVGKCHGETKPIELWDGLRLLHRTLLMLCSLNHLVRPKQSLHNITSQY